MKTISILFIAVLLSVSGFCRVRSVPPDNFRVLQSRCIDSVEFMQILVEIEGEMKVAVVREDCFCIVTRRSAISLFGFTAFPYVKKSELDEIYAIINK